MVLLLLLMVLFLKRQCFPFNVEC